jgi:hypothetical protein
VEREPVPAAFNWVKACHACSPEQVFIALREVVDSDIRDFTKIPHRSDEQIAMSSSTETKFVVVKKWNAGDVIDSATVVFERNAKGTISATDGHSQAVLFAGKPVLMPSGTCRLVIDGEDAAGLELWQVSRRALEGLFFPR